MHHAVAALVSLVLAAAPRAQEGDEAKFVKEAITKLNAYATLCQHNGYPKKAKETWLEVLAEYDTNDEVARKALGYVRVGTSWAPDPKFQAPVAKEVPDAAVAKQLQTRWNEAASFLTNGHKHLGQVLKDAQPERAKYHYERALRFNPADAESGAATGVQNFEGFFGNENEITILKRSRLMQRRVAELTQKPFPVEALPADQQQKHLVKANVPHKGFKTASFMVWGNHPDEVLKEAAMNAERALAFCKDAWDGVPGYPPKVAIVKEMVFLTSKDLYFQVLRANESVLGKSNVEFNIQHTNACALESARIGGHEHVASVHDQAVRWVVQDYSTMRSDGLKEGIGHAVVAMFFGKNLTFSVAQERKTRQGTSAAGAEDDPRLLVPDVETWAELATEMAWQRTGTPAAQLPLLKASSFPDEGRIKAWSFCDYLLRRDPAALVTLDRCMSEGTQEKVAAKFAEKSEGQQLGALDEAWRKFWTEDTPLLRAVKGKVTPLEATSKVAAEWLEAFNKVRKEFSPKTNAQGGKPGQLLLKDVGWTSSYSGECKSHVDYLKQNPGERGPANEQTEKASAKGGSNSGRTFAQMALVNTQQGKPEQIIESWLDLPGYRDAVLNPNLSTLGLYADGQIAVFDVTRGAIRRGRVTGISYPFNGQKSVPCEASLKDLGPEIQAALRKAGKEALKAIGYPLTFHSYSSMPKERGSVVCEVKAGGKDKVEGLLFFGDDGTNRRSSAPGLMVFLPYEPLKRGTEYEVMWNWEGKDKPETTKFNTK